MLYRHEYPVCEYDPDREALIRPSDFLQKCLPSRCVITFFRKELEAFVEERGLSVVGHLHSEVVDIPIYADEARSFCITMPFCTSPGAAGTIEELHAMGCERFLICGAAGGLAPGNRTGEIVVPLAAVSGAMPVVDLSALQQEKKSSNRLAQVSGLFEESAKPR